MVTQRQGASHEVRWMKGQGQAGWAFGMARHWRLEAKTRLRRPGGTEARRAWAWPKTLQPIGERSGRSGEAVIGAGSGMLDHKGDRSGRGAEGLGFDGRTGRPRAGCFLLARLKLLARA